MRKIAILGIGQIKIGEHWEKSLREIGGGAGFEATLEAHRVRAGGDVLEAFLDDRLAEDGGGGGAVASDVVGLGGDLLGQLGADVLEGVLEFDVLGDGHTVVGDGGGAELLIENDVAASTRK